MPLDAAAIMTRDVVTVGPDDRVPEIARRLAEHGISAVPVCDKDGTVLGMISEGDLLRPFRQTHLLQREWWLNVLAEGEQLAPSFLDYIRLDQRRARELMTTPVITVTETTPATEIAELLDKHHIKRVPVVRDGKLVGIVSRADLIRAIAKSPEALAGSV
jgi:CBS domain-containing protein